MGVQSWIHLKLIGVVCRYVSLLLALQSLLVSPYRGHRGLTACLLYGPACVALLRPLRISGQLARWRGTRSWRRVPFNNWIALLLMMLLVVFYSWTVLHRFLSLVTISRHLVPRSKIWARILFIFSIFSYWLWYLWQAILVICWSIIDIALAVGRTQRPPHFKRCTTWVISIGTLTPTRPVPFCLS